MIVSKTDGYLRSFSDGSLADVGRGLLIVSIILAFLFVFSTSGTVVAGDTVGNEVFLKGNYIEIGIHESGSFGTENGAPSGYHPIGRSQLGFVADMDKDGWNTGSPPQSGDHFLPGSPEEGWGVEWSYGGSEDNRTKMNFGRMGRFDIPRTSLTDTSSGGTQSAKWIGTAKNGPNEKLKIEKDVYFDEDDLFFVMETTITNTGSRTLDNVEFLRNVDPDGEQDLPGGVFSTNNYVAYQPGVGGNDDKALVVAEGPNYPSVVLGLGAVDSRAVVSTEGFSNRDPDVILDSPVTYPESSPNYADQAIALAFRFGTLKPGASVTFKYVYVLSEDDLEKALVSIANEPPVAKNDSAVVDEGSFVDIDVLNNDKDSDGSLRRSSVQVVSKPSHGSTKVKSNGVITYTPNPGYYGSDSFEYKVKDDDGASDTATVNVTVREGARFSVVDLTANPSSPMPIETVTITAQVVNSGGTKGSYEAVLMDGTRTIGSKMVVLGPGDQTTVKYSMSNLMPGQRYTVSIGGVSETFDVKAVGGLRAREYDEDEGTDPMVYVATVLGIAVIAFMAALIVSEAKK